MIPRYQTTKMCEIWSEENKLATWFKVEVIWLKNYLDLAGKSDNSLIERLLSKGEQIDWCEFKDRMNKHEETTRHDVIAFLCTLEDYLKEDAQMIHRALTSSDIVDTSFALLLKESTHQILSSLETLIKTIVIKAHQCRGVICLGRTHGQSAEPITFAVKLLSHASELLRNFNRIKTAQIEISVGKFSGAVGAYSLADPQVEKAALKELGLTYEEVASQVVCRDRYAFYSSTLAVLAASLERLATELRLLCHGQVAEVSEGFFAGQKGSSAMPHKKNPILCENICGLMRTARSYLTATFENQILWHERDISHSSAERIIAPSMAHLLDLGLTRMTEVIQNLYVNTEKMKENIDDAGEILYSQKVLLALIDKGVMRQQSYELVQKSVLAKGSFKENLKKNNIYDHLSKEELEKLFTSFEIEHEEMFFKRVKNSCDAVFKNLCKVDL